MNVTPQTTAKAVLFLRIALAAAFVSAVADRFGLWGPAGTPNVAWGGFAAYLDYTALLLPFLPRSLITVLGWAATILEVVLGIALLVGMQLRLVALASGALLLTFALAMTFSLGAEPALSYSVWTAAASAFLLACLPATTPGR